MKQNMYHHCKIRFQRLFIYRIIVIRNVFCKRYTLFKKKSFGISSVNEQFQMKINDFCFDSP